MSGYFNVCLNLTDILELPNLAEFRDTAPLTTALLSGGGCQGLPPLAQPALRQSYAPIAGKPAPSSHEPPRQWNQAPVTLIYQWKNKGGWDGGKRMIQRLNEENGHQENTVLNTWR